MGHFWLTQGSIAKTDEMTRILSLWAREISAETSACLDPLMNSPLKLVILAFQEAFMIYWRRHSRQRCSKGESRRGARTLIGPRRRAVDDAQTQTESLAMVQIDWQRKQGLKLLFTGSDMLRSRVVLFEPILQNQGNDLHAEVREAPLSICTLHGYLNGRCKPRRKHQRCLDKGMP